MVYFNKLLLLCCLLICLLICLLLSQTTQATLSLDDTYKKERILFIKAEKAFKKKESKKYQAYYAQLDHYPLQAYLKYKEYRKNLSQRNEKQVLEFFKDYKQTPYENWLRMAWLNKMAKKGQWKKYLNAYTPQKSVSRQCSYMNALLKTGKKKQAFEKVPKLWLIGKSQAKECDPVFSAYKKAGLMTPELIWERIKLAIDKGSISLANYLAHSLSKKDQQWVKEWGDIYHQPERVLTRKLFKKNHPIKSTIQSSAVKRMAKKDAEKAIKLFTALEKKNTFSLAEYDKMYRAIGMKLAYHHGDGAWSWLNKISDKNSDETVRQWRTRSAVRDGNWEAISHSLARLSEEEKQSFRWQYWLASSKEHSGEKMEAEKIYKQLAKNRSYYGFLAADKMALPYDFQNVPLIPHNKALLAVKENLGILRSREFYLLGRTIEANREWYFTTRQQMNNDERAIAAKVAQQWGWNNRAIITMAHTDERNDIELRFPILEKKWVKKYSKEQKLQPAYTLAVIRRESAFATDARSRVGALGLMQIMPATGKVIAKKLKVNYKNKNQLLNPEINVKFGTKYLNMMLNKFHEQPVLASAAYNAGGHRVRKWLPKEADMSADRWVESIPFKETREYVSSILAYTAIYENRLGLKQTRLSAMMPDVPKK